MQRILDRLDRHTVHQFHCRWKQPRAEHRGNRDAGVIQGGEMNRGGGQGLWPWEVVVASAQ